MKVAAIKELKDELSHLPANKLVDICTRLARFKAENKELLTFILFESDDIPGYIHLLKTEMEEQFSTVNKTNVYFAKKTIRKMLRVAGKHIRISGSTQAEIELLICFCRNLRNSGLPMEKGSVLYNLYQSQIKKIERAISSLHEDLQYDYRKEMQSC